MILSLGSCTRSWNTSIHGEADRSDLRSRMRQGRVEAWDILRCCRQWRLNDSRSIEPARQAQVPAHATFEQAEQRARHAAEVPALLIAVFLVVADAPGEDMIDEHFID